jgi:flagellar biosynthesis protein FlhG
VSVSGGKGGVGKSTIAVNLALSYARLGHRTLIVDGDFGMADLNLLLGQAPKKSLVDVVEGISAADVLIECHGLHLLPSANGCFRLANPDRFTKKRITEVIGALRSRFETTVLDTPAGIENNSLSVTAMADDILIVANPEPLSLADAYAAMKVLAHHHGVRRLFVVPNCVRSQAQGDELAQQLVTLVNHFLDVELVVLPSIPYDARLSQSALNGVPLVLAQPDAPVSRAIARVARALDACSSTTPHTANYTEARP